MGDHRSNLYADGRMQMVRYYGPTSNPRDLSSYVAAASSYGAQPTQIGGGGGGGGKETKGKTVSGFSSKSWSFSDPEFQRKKRVASYKVYAVEGKVKESFRKSFRWLKDRYSRVVYGWL